MAPKPFEDVRAVAVAVAVGVGVVALVAGIAIAGLPQSVPNDIAITDVAADPTSSTVAADVPSVATSTTQRVSSTSSSTVERGSNDTRTADARRPSTTQQAKTVPTSAAASPPPASPVVKSEAQLRVVVANAGGANGLAARYTEIVGGFGYASVEPANATDRRDESVVYWSPGREAEARRLAEQLGVASVEPIPGERFVLGDFVADLWAMIGLDLEDR